MDGKMKFSQLVKECTQYLAFCKDCKHYDACQRLVSAGVPRPYQYKGVNNVSILGKTLNDLTGEKKDERQTAKRISA